MRHALLRGALVIALSMGTGAALAQAPVASDDSGRWELRAEGRSLVLMAQGVPLKTYAVARRDGRQPSTVSAIRYLPVRRSFAVAFDALAELWELSLDPQAAPIHDGLVHDYRMGEALAEPGYLGLRRTPLDSPLAELTADDSGAYVLGRVATADGGAELQLVQLDVRRTIGRFRVDATPDLASARTHRSGGRVVLSLTDRRGGPPVRIDLKRATLLPTDDPVAD